MIFGGIVKSSFVDYPGLVSCVLFLPGCNYDCYYCHNRSLLDGTFTPVSSDWVFEFLEKRVGLLDAVVISGGEPTLQKDLDLFSLLQRIRALGYKTKLDTNGAAPERIQELLSRRLCDYYAVDYKAPAKRYREICGNTADARKVLETIRMLKESGVLFEARSTVIPELSVEDLIQMAKELPVLPRYVLNRFRAPEKFLPRDACRVKKPAATQIEINSFLSAIKEYQPNVTT